ncbi:hypothetical protein, partial [Paenibacillus sp. GbtcB18]|uniref:hypothetical protein n=1 Tax=Paenibacillus sp. GbtcB18 TaxID=2824763 RepID=UPI001C2FC691
KGDREEGTLPFLGEAPKEWGEPNYLGENARRLLGEGVFLAKERSKIRKKEEGGENGGTTS